MKSILTLTGHTAAVTSVDWKIMNDNSEILVSCSDDRTIRIYKVIRNEKVYPFKKQKKEINSKKKKNSKTGQ